MRESRIAKLRERLVQNKLDAILITNLPNIFYLSGFTGSTAILFVSRHETYILIDPRYTLQAQKECQEVKIVEYCGKSSISASADLINSLNISHLGFEMDNLTVSQHKSLRKQISSSITLKSTSGLVEQLRAVKDSSEIERIKQAAAISDAAFSSIVKQIHYGMTEKDVALLIDSTLRRLGADKESFDTIAAAGPNSACPHASPTNAVITPGQPLKLDFGAKLNNYNSDITRTISIGKPTEQFRDIYKIVLDAQLMAIDAIRPGVAGKEIDSIARNYISSKGYGDNFGHGLGHAIGIEVHDGPGLSQTSPIILEPGMVVTVEPGIYIEGWGGVRIEDDVLVTDSGHEIITQATKEIIAI